jgi:hypothetical protein
MPNYVNTVIYVIKCKNEEILDCYVGNTTNLKSRKTEHKYNCLNESSKSYTLKVYDFIRNNGGWNNFEIIELEKYSCNSKKEAEMREHYWYFTLGSTLNMISPILDEDKRKNTLRQNYEKRRKLDEEEREKKKKEKEHNREEHLNKKKEEWATMRQLRYNKEENTAKMRIWRELNPGKNAEYCRKYSQKH